MKKDIAMTPEQKAKAYDKALEKAKKELNACGSLDCNAARQIFRFFPELREEEKPLTPFQQCLNCILRGVYYAEVPDKKVNEFILNVVRTRTDELIKLAKRHEYTDCQLHKSEDERIRKAIMVYLDWLTGFPDFAPKGDFSIRDMLYYLEKQKEQKPVEPISKETCLNEMLKNGQISLSDYLSLTKEQKPACGDDFKWTSQDERCRSKLIDVLELVDAAYPTTKDSRDELWEWLKELPMKFPNKNAFIAGTLDNDDEWSQTEEILGPDGNPTCYKQKPAESSNNLDELMDDYFEKLEVPEHQIIFEDTFRKIAKDFYEMGCKSKPAEWSEKHIADIFEKVGLAKIAREQGNDKLTNALQDAMLELSKVENAEWSEEDSKRYISIATTLETSAVLSKEDYDANMVWLRDLVNSQKYSSPQPHWKPSKEQMEAFKNSVEHIPNAYYDDMWELYEQLKKL